MDNFNIELYENVFENPEEIFQRLEAEVQYLPAEQTQVRIRGKTVPIPRQQVAFGDADLTYTFSGLTVACQPWSPLLKEIKTHVESLCGESFNFVLVNRYKDGNSCIGQHMDNEPDLDPTATICSVSFGETRTLVFKKQPLQDKRFELKGNSVLLMKPPTNTEWTHGIPRQKDRAGVRINLTFRKIVNNKKRKSVPMTEEVVPKKPKTTVDGAFTQGDWENVFPVDRDIFIVVRQYRDNVLIHLRQFKRYGNKFYPTKEGITIQPDWFDRIFARTAPRTPIELEASHFFVSKDLKIISQDFSHFELQRDQKCITLTDTEWNIIANKLAAITTLAIHYQVRAWDFKKVFGETRLQDMPDAQHALEFSNPSTQDFTKILVSCVCELVKQQEEEASATLFGDPAALRTDSIVYFNRCVMMFTLQDLVQLFMDRVFGYSSPIIPTVQTVEHFLNSVELTHIIDEARFDVCSLEFFAQDM